MKISSNSYIMFYPDAGYLLKYISSFWFQMFQLAYRNMQYVL